MQTAALFPSPSSGFVPTQDEETFRDVLDSRVSKQQQRKDSMSASGGTGNEDKENAVPVMSRTSSTSSLKQTSGKQRRRSSAAHPLSPSSSSLRSRNGSFSNVGGANTSQQYVPSTLSGKSSRRNSSYSLASSSCDQPSGSNSNNNSSLDFAPAFANMALPEDSALQIDEDEDEAPAMSISPKSKSSSSNIDKDRRRSSSGSSKKNDNGKRRSRRISNEQAEESEISDTPPSARSSKRLSNARSASTLVPGRNVDSTSGTIDTADNGWEPTPDESQALQRTKGWEEPAAVTHVIPIKIRDFAFPPSDPRYIGELPAPDPIHIPSASSNSYNPYAQTWYDSSSANTPNTVYTSNNGFLSIHGTDTTQDPSTSMLSSSSSSSLSSSFTPPPIGSFGFGHHYHYAGNAPQQSQHHANSTKIPEWSTWGTEQTSPRRASTQQQQQSSTSPTSAPSTSSSKYCWNFITDNTPQQGDNDSSITTSSQDTDMPSALVGSSLRIDHDFEGDFEDDDDDEDDDREEVGEDQIPSGGLLYRAAYPFAAEAPQEMGLTEGDLVRIYEKLCDGWVVGTKVTLHGHEERETGENGLIPENYLSLAEDLLESADDDHGEDEEGEAVPEEGKTAVDRTEITGGEARLNDVKEATP